jgi:RNA polymerase sigma-70 factor (ECF subfamily)
METDAELVRRSLRGETAAFGVLAERHRAAVAGFCYRHVGDFDTAEDLAQETFLRAYFDLHALREPGSFGPWLKAIALRLCQSWRRRRQELLPLPPEELAASAQHRPAEHAAITVWQARCLAEEALASLPEAQRRAMTLKYRDGYTLLEIAVLTQVPVETVRTRLRRARHRLQESLATEVPEGEHGMKRREFLQQSAGVVGAATVAATAGAAGRTPPSDAAFARRIVEKLDLVQKESGLTWPVYAALHASGSDWSFGYLDGALGSAFQFAVEENVGGTEPTAVLEWGAWFQALKRLDYEVRVFDARRRSFSPAVVPQTEEEFRACQAAAWDAARAGIDRGVPAIAWMPITPKQKARGEGCEYALLVGYDTATGCYHVRMPGRALWTIPWDGFGRADPINWFNVIVLGAARPGDAREREREALRFAVAHARSTHPRRGLAAYAAWRQALDLGKLPGGNAPRLARWQHEAKGNAALFLREIAGRFPAATESLNRAGADYGRVSDAWAAYAELHQPDAPLTDAARLDAAREALERARAAEEAAVAALEEALGRMEAA